MNPLRKFLKRFYRKPIPLMAWKSALIELFKEFKKSMTSSPVLTIFDNYKSTFLKTNWSAKVMGWILMQPADDEK